MPARFRILADFGPRFWPFSLVKSLFRGPKIPKFSRLRRVSPLLQPINPLFFFRACGAPVGTSIRPTFEAFPPYYSADSLSNFLVLVCGHTSTSYISTADLLMILRFTTLYTQHNTIKVVEPCWLSMCLITNYARPNPFPNLTLEWVFS